MLLDEFTRSGLTGRGGAGFPAARKLSAANVSRESRMWASSPIIVANGAEGEPRSVKDATLLHHAPHLVLDGLLAAASAVGASSLYIYAPARALSGVRSAMRERRDTRSITLVEARESFISGEATAVVNAIENGIALPTDRTQHLTTTGIRRRPTLVHNVETLAHVGLVARYGANWFRSVGSERDPGTRLVTVSGHLEREQVLEIAGHAMLSDVLVSSGIDLTSVSAVLVGGYHGTWIGRDHLDANLSAGGLAKFGATPGAGIIFVLGTHECGLAATAKIVRFLADESARQCGPCMFGLPEMARLFERVAAGDRDHDLSRQLDRLGRSVIGRGACHHPDGTARLVSSALDTFAADVDAHVIGRCRRSNPPTGGDRG
ncbi:MAG: NADH-ubiquinone oxidoreductase-F iron-sulfur binding region domain-containing protein [Actinomycetota bacterium]